MIAIPIRASSMNLDTSWRTQPGPERIFNLVLGQSTFEIFTAPAVGNLLNVSKDRVRRV